MIELTGLGPEQKKKIGALSKGYRQRVGLAQSMLHDPAVLILDEPTTGLDPNQLIEIRQLIRNIGKEKTVILSTHIMQEVEAICDRTIIVNKGKIVADEKTAVLKEKLSGRNVVIVEFDKPIFQSEIGKVKGVNTVSNVKGNIWKLESDQQVDIRQQLFQFAVQQQVSILAMQKEESNLESVFRQLTVDK
jgi:ABC-2 type transport system ATP-binding protein